MSLLHYEKTQTDILFNIQTKQKRRKELNQYEYLDTRYIWIRCLRNGVGTYQSKYDLSHFIHLYFFLFNFPLHTDINTLLIVVCVFMQK